jgi:hypothetical protein
MGKKRAQPLPETGCHTCRFWTEETEPGDDERSGSCRRFPPTPILDADEGLFMTWPWTQPQELCGEHQPRLQ